MWIFHPVRFMKLFSSSSSPGTPPSGLGVFPEPRSQTRSDVALRTQMLLPSRVSEMWHLLSLCVLLSLEISATLQVTVGFRIRRFWCPFTYEVCVVPITTQPAVCRERVLPCLGLSVPGKPAQVGRPPTEQDMACPQPYPHGSEVTQNSQLIWVSLSSSFFFF